MENAIESFKTRIRSHGLQPPKKIVPGQFHRFPGLDKGWSNGAGWCKLFEDLHGGVFGDFSTGLDEHWQADSERAYSAEEKRLFKQRLDAERRQREADLAKQYEAAARKCTDILEVANADPAQHQYAIDKGVPLGHRIKRGAWDQRGWHDALLIPLFDKDGKVCSLEAINVDGKKDYLAGGRKRGSCYPFTKVKGAVRVLIGEGVATVAAVHAVAGAPAVAAMDAGNLRAVAETIHEKAPDAEIIFLADNDIKPDGSNPGLKAAFEAAQAVGGRVAVPELGGKKCDFWDVWHQLGEDAVKNALAQAQEATAQTVATFATSATNPPQIMMPEPLRGELPKSEPYPVDQLGDLLGKAALALHETVKAPLALCCQSVLAAASFAAQSHFDITLPWGERKPLSLFFLTVAVSGERKSAVDGVVLSVAKAHEKAEMAGYQIEREQYEADLAKWKAATEGARKKAATAKKSSTADEAANDLHEAGPKPAAPIMPLRFLTDPTVEGMFKLLVDAQPSIALFSDEGGLLIGGSALNNDNFLKTITRWCKLWDGAAFDRVRAGDGSDCLYGRRMALHQLAQPEVMQTLLSNRLANGQGLLARCLVAWPESTIGSRHIQRFESARDRLEVQRFLTVFNKLSEAEPRTNPSDKRELDPVELQLSGEAKQMLVNAHNRFEDLMAPGADLEELRDRTAKALENACRIAAILAVFENGLATREIDQNHLSRALILMQWYLAEALRIRGASIVPQSVLDAETVSKWLSNKGIVVFNQRLLLNKGPGCLRANKQRLSAAISELLNAGYIAKNEPGLVIDGAKSRLSWTVLHVV